MGQKVNPLGFRIGITEPWRSRWYANKKDFRRLISEDQKIRKMIKKEFYSAAIPRIDIERTREAVTVVVHTARPGVLIGRKGARIDQLRTALEKISGTKVDIKTLEVDRPEHSAQLVAESVSEQLEKRVSFRRALKKTAMLSMQGGALGVKIMISGRLGGAEMSRTEKVAFGSVPLSTLRADVDYGFAEAKTTYGVIGVKCWIYRGMRPVKEKKTQAQQQPPVQEVSNG